MSKHSPEPRKTNTDAIADLTRQRDELLGLVRAVVCHSTVKDVMGVKCAAFPWTEYEGLAAKVKEISDES